MRTILRMYLHRSNNEVFTGKVEVLMETDEQCATRIKLVSAVNSVLKGVIYEKRTENVLDMIFDGMLFGDVGGEVVEKYARDVMRKHFSVWKLFQVKDTALLQGLGHVRCMEQLEKR